MKTNEQETVPCRLETEVYKADCLNYNVEGLSL